MIRKLPFSLLLLLLTISALGQLRDSSWAKTISLTNFDYIKKSKRIILFQSDTFIVYSTFDLTVSNIKKFIDEYEVEEDKQLLDKFFNTSKSLDRNLDDIRDDKALASRLDFRIADLIQRRECLIYNKIEKAFESDVIMTNYILNYWTGVRFATKANQQIIDIITGAF